MNTENTTRTSPIDAPESAPAALRWLILTGWALVVYQLAWWGLFKPLEILGVFGGGTYPNFPADYPKHWLAARELLAGHTIYGGPEGENYLVFNHPHAVAYAFFWLGLLPKLAGFYAWLAVGWACIAGTILVAVRHLRPTDASAILSRHWLLIAALAITLYTPLTTCLHVGNIDPLNALLAMAFVAMLMRADPAATRRRHQWLTGTVWAGLILVKLLPLALALPLLLWGRWRVFQGAAATLFAYVLALMIIGHAIDEWEFLTQMMPSIPHRWSDISYGVPPFLVRLASAHEVFENRKLYTHVIELWLLAGGAIYAMALAALRLRKVPLTRAIEPALLFFPLLSPLLEWHHFVWVLPVLVLHIRRFTQREMPVFFAALYMPLWLIVAFSFTIIDTSPWRGLLVLHCHMLAVAALFVVNLVELLTISFRQQGNGK